MNRYKSLFSIFALLALFVSYTVTYSAPAAYTEQFARSLSQTPFNWTSTSSTAGGVPNVADAQASDGKALKLTIAAG